MDNTLQKVGQRIREIRIQRGFASQEALAEYLNVHRTFVGHLETGRKDFRLSTMIKVAEALGVTLSDLFAGIERGDALNPKRIARRGEAEHLALLREFAVLERSVGKLKELL